jgi:hypothetical protein
MEGTVTAMEDDVVQISGGGLSLEDAEAETEAEAAR